MGDPTHFNFILDQAFTDAKTDFIENSYCCNKWHYVQPTNHSEHHQVHPFDNDYTILEYWGYLLFDDYQELHYLQFPMSNSGLWYDLKYVSVLLSYYLVILWYS